MLSELTVRPMAAVIVPGLASTPAAGILKDLLLFTVGMCQLMWQAVCGAGAHAAVVLLSRLLHHAARLRQAAAAAAATAAAATRLAARPIRLTTGGAQPRGAYISRGAYAPTVASTNGSGRASSIDLHYGGGGAALASPRQRRQSCPAPSLCGGPLLPPQLPHHAGRLTVVLDLDETLVAPPRAPASPRPATSTSSSSPAALRPGVGEFLERLAQTAEIVLWTAAGPAYAERQLRALDPRGRLFSGRVCGGTTGGGGGAGPGGADGGGTGALRGVKDLSRLGRDLRRTVLVDNCVGSMRLQPKNGIPCPPFRGDMGDQVRAPGSGSPADGITFCQRANGQLWSEPTAPISPPSPHPIHPPTTHPTQPLTGAAGRRPPDAAQPGRAPRRHPPDPRLPDRPDALDGDADGDAAAQQQRRE
jgi:RNA polymerase II subunit A small phosphatase-like protein